MREKRLFWLKRRGQKEFAMIKFDMSKTYDWIEWSFLESMLSRLGFSESHDEAHYASCPLFSLSMVMEAESSASVRCVKIARNAPCMSHLLFADCNLVFCEDSLGAIQVVFNFLARCDVVSGQKVNIEKSSVVLSQNVSEDDRVSLNEALGIRVIEKDDNIWTF
ncbi:hypothetical protein Sango_0817700 [Sesamum angolense]|uniref:Reverse transcriptase domain-containing protein n=1 Tax=Sesamum angolense TaxID=2727404 RepID=A0AAE1X3K8_9LAMI|nr:hypothetical protein Sango_0817700 [Sesamum angolense]